MRLQNIYELRTQLIGFDALESLPADLLKDAKIGFLRLSNCPYRCKIGSQGHECRKS